MMVELRAWACIACHAKNSPTATACEQCGVAKPPARAPKSGDPRPHQCELDGGTLDARGFCIVANGFVLSAACPFACPFCRHALTWEGKCFACFGCSTGKRENWTVPGDRYELEHGHWYLVEPGPRPVCTPKQNADPARIEVAVLDGLLTEEQGHDMLELMGIPR